MSNTIPYLMHLSSMSEILLQPIVQVFLELCRYIYLFSMTPK